MRWGSTAIGRDDRAAFSLLLALLWLFGMELAPAIHLARHDALGAHEHHGAVHREPRRLRTAALRHGHDDDRPGGAGHGEASLEHRGVAVLAPAEIVAAIAGAPVAAIAALPIVRARGDRIAIDLPPARGPPPSTRSSA